MFICESLERRGNDTCVLLATAITVGFVCVSLAETTAVTQDFATDPNWDGRNNVRMEQGREKKQDFGFSQTNHAGGGIGEIGGSVCRSVKPATYSVAIEPKTLDDQLKASGRFNVTHSEGGSGLLVGWFNSTSRGWRTPNALFMRIDGESNSFRIFYEYGTQNWKTGGGQTFEGMYQTNPSSKIPVGGKPHEWSIEYDPDGAEGRGEIALTLDGEVFKAPLDEGHKADGATFDRFGIMNQQIYGDHLTAYFDDITIDGKRFDFAADPKWEGAGNRDTFSDIAIRPHHDFGHRPTNFAGGEPGEIGGFIWRIESVDPEHAGYYGAPTGRLTMNDKLTASGKVSFRRAAVDCGLLIGWFNSHTAIGAPPNNFVGVLVEGPSRIGHYFRPVYGASDDQRGIQDEGPIFNPDGKQRTWSVVYDPDANAGHGRITATLDGESVDMDLPETARKGNAVFDRFGIVSWQRGGHYVEMYFDDITYTAAE
ncbi:MAG: hypothetical protein HUU46_14885 [Candidatus Hydrogenedentes bacterium]|nr:hypothetical protein [Candidatus Hydrogenedentota bacterium]